MSNDPRTIKRMIEHYRRLREWITDLRTRRALRELIGGAEKQLHEIEGHTEAKQLDQPRLQGEQAESGERDRQRREDLLAKPYDEPHDEPRR